MQHNLDVRLACRANSIPLWQLARQLRLSDASLYRKLRRPLSESERMRFYEAIAILTARTAKRNT